MEKRLNYSKLIKGWMQYYTLPEDTAEKLFGSIWAQLQESKEIETPGKDTRERKPPNE